LERRPNTKAMKPRKPAIQPERRLCQHHYQILPCSNPRLGLHDRHRQDREWNSRKLNKLEVTVVTHQPSPFSRLDLGIRCTRDEGRQHGAPWPPETAGIHRADRPGAGGNTSGGEIRNCSVPLSCPNRHPHYLLNAKAGETWSGRPEIIAQAGRPGRHDATNSMAGRRHRHHPRWATAITWPASKLGARCCCPAWWRPEEANVPPFHCLREAAVGASAAAPPAWPMPPSEAGAIGALLIPCGPHRANRNNPGGCWQGNWSRPWAIGALLVLTEDRIAQAAEKAPTDDAPDPEPAPS